MTISFRNRLILIFSLLSALISAVLFIYFYNNYTEIQALYDQGALEIQSWWFLQNIGNEQSFSLSILSLAALILVGSLGNWILHPLFRKSSSQEMYYFRVFLLSLSLNGLRLLHYYIELQHYGLHYHLLLTRISYLLRLLGLGTIFLSGIAIFEKKFQRMRMIFLSVVFITFAMSMIIPVNQEFILGSLLNPLMDEITLFLFIQVLQLLVLMNFVMYFYQRRSRENLIVLIGIILIVISLDLSFFLGLPGLILTVTALPLGIIIFCRKIYKLYQWR